ncbi:MULTISPECIES: DUF485 domain-containing protein [Streptomyces]|uniref:DUF485 domain-containing protein n=1 Tax=Streptomyces TaxID=1883 RepID=UPI002041E306|nr:DUF485 domain-containing protein [Streptomyces thermoviolaceus]MCM3263240.1 DUF485 domain-containing protein [Streptomyces thermoviolaceus]
MQSRNSRPHGHGGGPVCAPAHQGAHDEQTRGTAEIMPCRGPWHDAPAPGRDRRDRTGAVAPVPAARRERRTGRMPEATAQVYLDVQRSAAFQQVRTRYRRFVVPGAAAFLLWYVAYVVAATAAPGWMARPVVGAVNVAMLAGLAQFLSAFLFAWAYARHARLRRDRAALDLRWDTQDRTRHIAGGAS